MDYLRDAEDCEVGHVGEHEEEDHQGNTYHYRQWQVSGRAGRLWEGRGRVEKV